MRLIVDRGDEPTEKPLAPQRFARMRFFLCTGFDSAQEKVWIRNRFAAS
jgi:hypothetical protein